MIILTFPDTQSILGLSRLGAAGSLAKLRPVQLNDGTFMLDERVLDDPDHADVAVFLGGLPTRTVLSSEIAPEGINLLAQGWTPDGYRPGMFLYNGHWYAVQTPGEPYSMTTSGAQRRFEIRQGEVGSTFDPVGVRHRVEVMSTEWVGFSETLWWSQSVYVESASDFIVMGQFRAQEDDGDFGSSEPVLSLQFYAGEDLAIIFAGTADPVHTEQPAHTIAWQAACPLRTWLNFVFRFVLDPLGAGELQVWKDGVEIIDLTGLTIGYNDALGPRFKFGAYCDDAGVSAVRYANVEWGTADLSDRVANPLPL